SVVALVVLVYGVIQGGESNDWVKWNTLGAIVLGLALLALFVWLQKRSTHPTIDVDLFKNRYFSAGAVAIGLTFFALMGSTFYLAYFLQAVRGYTPLAAGVALIAVAAAVMILAPLSARLAARFGPRVVCGFGMTLFGLTMASYGLVRQDTGQWVIEIQMFCMGAGMGLTMSPATTAIMSAVPREKAGAGSAVNNTVRQVAGALGVAILGSILAVAFRNSLGAGTPGQVASRLDQPAAVVSQLPANTRVSTYATTDASQSIGNALEFVADAAKALQARGQTPVAQAVPAAQRAQLEHQAQQTIEKFLSDSKSSFMTGMRATSLAAGGAALIGAAVAFTFLPGRRELAEQNVRSGTPAAEPAVVH
ncbi:MAG: MFS transporter, partial [Actinobacteria bacterium]|nr:MFS transporter [Actinomycetota bacterium]